MLRGVQLTTSDDHAGWKAARKAVFGGVPWQRCQFHLQQNVSVYVPGRAMPLKMATDIRAIFNVPNRSSTEFFLQKAVEKYAKIVSELAAWLKANIPEGSTVFAFPAAHRCLIRTTNGLERISREVRRRTRVVGIFSSNEASCLHVVSAILIEIDDAWQVGRLYQSFEENEPPP